MAHVLRWRAGMLAVQVFTLALSMASSRISAAAGIAASRDSIPSDSTLALSWLEANVLGRNPTLAAARAAWEESRAAARQAGALEDPMLEGMVAPRSLTSGSVDPAYKVGVVQRYPLFGQRGLRRGAALAEAEARGFDFETARLDLLREARAGFFEYYRVVRSQETNRELIDLVQRFHRAALAKYAAGTVGQTDPLQAEVELAMLKHQTVVLERQRRVVVAQLNALLHARPGSRLPPPPRKLPRPDATEEWLEVRGRAAWPELRAAEARVAARKARLTLARRQRLPEGAVGMAYDRFWAEPELRATVGLSLNLPIQLGRLAEAQREARAGLAIAEQERDAVRDRIEKEIETASARFHEYSHEVQIMQDEVVPATERALNAVRAAYEADRSDFLALLNASRDLARARLGLHEALAMLNEAHADLLRAVAADARRPGQEDRR